MQSTKTTLSLGRGWRKAPGEGRSRQESLLSELLTYE